MAHLADTWLEIKDSGLGLCDCGTLNLSQVPRPLIKALHKPMQILWFVVARMELP